MWKNINILLGKQVNRSQNFPIKIDGQILSDPLSIASQFNNYFTSIGLELASSLNSSRNFNKYRTIHPVERSLFLEPVSEAEINNIIIELSPNKSPGPDKISAQDVQKN